MPEFHNFGLPAGSRANIKYIGLVAAAIACGRATIACDLMAAAMACGRGQGKWRWPWLLAVAVACGFGQGFGGAPWVFALRSLWPLIVCLWPVAMAMASGRHIGFWFLPRLWP